MTQKPFCATTEVNANPENRTGMTIYRIAENFISLRSILQSYHFLLSDKKHEDARFYFSDNNVYL